MKLSTFLNKDETARLYTSARDDGTGNPITDVEVKERILVEQQTNTDAVSNEITFSENIKYIEIYNTDPSNTGVFNVNGFDIHVPPGISFESRIGGTPRDTVSVSGTTSYIISRYE
jgi:hypothetical protein